MNNVMDLSVMAIAAHYANKIDASGMAPSEAEIAKAIEANWDSIKNEISSLYTVSTHLIAAK